MAEERRVIIAEAKRLPKLTNYLGTVMLTG
jgi:hypothetical protein